MAYLAQLRNGYGLDNTCLLNVWILFCVMFSALAEICWVSIFHAADDTTHLYVHGIHAVIYVCFLLNVY